jgi:hypothetical protein
VPSVASSDVIGGGRAATLGSTPLQRGHRELRRVARPGPVTLTDAIGAIGGGELHRRLDLLGAQRTTLGRLGQLRETAELLADLDLVERTTSRHPQLDGGPLHRITSTDVGERTTRLNETEDAALLVLERRHHPPDRLGSRPQPVTVEARPHQLGQRGTTGHIGTRRAHAERLADLVENTGDQAIDRLRIERTTAAAIGLRMLCWWCCVPFGQGADLGGATDDDGHRMVPNGEEPTLGANPSADDDHHRSTLGQ